MIDLVLYIYHHLGLGDHIICNGLVRHFKKSYEKIYVFCKPHNFENVKYMYRDDPNILILPIGEDYDVVNYINDNNIESKTLKVGFNNLWVNNPSTFDIGFYNSANIPFNIRFTDFKIIRDYERENYVYNELNPDNQPFIFLHEDQTRGFLLDRKKIKSNLKIIENNTNYGFFDLLGLIEKAEEVHIMQSSFKDLINSIEFKKPKFYYHRYVRNYPDSFDTQGLNKFIKID